MKMEKHTLLFFILVIDISMAVAKGGIFGEKLKTVMLVSDNLQIEVEQSAQIPGGLYANIASPTVKFEKLSNGRLNLKYDFSFETEKDLDSILVLMRIEFMKELEYSVISNDGFNSHIVEGNQLPCIFENRNSVIGEIPLRRSRKGFIELQITIPEKYVGNDIPINVSFEQIRPKLGKVTEFFVRLPLSNIRITTPLINYEISKNDNSIRLTEKCENGFEVHTMTDSMRQYRIQVR